MPVVSVREMLFASLSFTRLVGWHLVCAWYNVPMSKLVIICGISFAGKSTLGEAIAQRFGYAQVDVDDMKFHVYGPERKDEELRRADWVRIYHETDKLIASYLQSGKTVIDASRNFRKDERQLARHMATQLKAEVVTIFVDTPEGIARKRLLENRRKKYKCDVTDTDFEEILQVWEPPTADENPLVQVTVNVFRVSVRVFQQWRSM